MNLRIYYKYLSSRIASKWTVLLVDVIIVVISMLSACFLQYRLSSVSYEISLYVWLTILAVLCNVCFFHILRTYVGVIRFSSFVDIYRVLWSLTISYAVLFLGNYCWSVSGLGETLPNSILFMAYMFTFSLMACMRIAVKMLYEAIAFDARHCVNVFIYGFHGTGVNVAKSLRVSRNNHYRLRGFISDEPDMIGKHTMGCRVYPNDEQLFDCLKKKKVDTIIISPSKVSDLENSGMLDKLFSHDIHVMTVPPLSDCMDDGLIKDIQIEDWLRREPVQVDVRKITAHIEGRRVMVTGAAGSIGSELCRQLAHLGIRKLIMFDSAETPLHNIRLECERRFPHLDFVPVIGDVRVIERLRMVFDTYHPQIIFHAAAYKHVPLMEENPCEAVLVNVTGTRQVADMAVKYGAEKMIMVSTDKAVNPTNVMGCSKRLAEIYVQSLSYAIKEGKVKGCTKFITTRFGNVLGSNGSVIPRFKEQIENGGPVTVTHPDIIRYFMTIPEACRLVMEAATMGEGYEIFVFEMGKPVKIVDLAVRMIELAGYKPNEDIEIQFTGLRPGEKLYEEVLSDEENTIPTHHKKIKIAKVRRYEYGNIVETYDEFERLSRSVQIWNTVKLMKWIVPEFKSKNSRFEELDN